MKILCYTDTHFCEKSSILTRYGTRYTQRLENLIKSINWAEDLAKEQECDYVICLGDFFDKPHVTDQELTALMELSWADCPHYFLVGNHESEENDLQYSSTMALSKAGFHIISEPTLKTVDENLEFAFLPYILESNRKALSEYFQAVSNKTRLLFSHNDLAGIQLGPIISRAGFSLTEIEAACDLCLNGHLHNGITVSPKILNLGNLTGKDFSENALQYAHKAVVIDTDLMQLQTYENPYAFNFYKLEINSEEDFSLLNQIKANAVLSLKCRSHLVPQLQDLIKENPNIVETRIIMTKELLESALSSEATIAELCVDQCAKFAECCRTRLDNTDILEQELAEILK